MSAAIVVGPWAGSGIPRRENNVLNDVGYRELCDILVALKGEMDKGERSCIKGRAVGFVRDQIQREHDYGQSVFMSPKQMKWLREIYAEVTGEALPQDDRGDLEPVDERLANARQDASQRNRRRGNRDPDDRDDEEIPF